MTKYQMFDKLREGVQVISRDMRYLYVNQAVADQCMQTVEDLTGHRMLDKFPSLRDSEVYKKIEECMETGASCDMLNVFEQLDGSKGWFDLRIEPVDDGAIIFSFDITDQKRLEADVRKLNEGIDAMIDDRTKELMDNLRKEKDLNEFKTKFVSMASHQFRTPLTSIILSADLVEKYGSALEQKEQIAKHFTRIKSSAKHMVSVLNDFLAFDQIESDKVKYYPEQTDFNLFVQEVSDSLSPLLKDGQIIRSRIHPDPCVVQIDPQVIKAVMLNLLSNAIKYSPEGSEILISAQRKEESLCFEVIDEGIGIPKTEQERLFETFFRASNAKSIQGSGLGLNIVKQYVGLARGTVTFCSVEGKGTSFRVSLPQAT